MPLPPTDQIGRAAEFAVSLDAPLLIERVGQRHGAVAGPRETVGASG